MVATEKYLFGEGINTVCSDILNGEIVMRPTTPWYKQGNFFIKKRPGVQLATGTTAEGEIQYGISYNGNIYFYTKVNASSGKYDGTTMSIVDQTHPYSGGYDRQMLIVPYIGGGDYGDYDNDYKVDTYTTTSNIYKITFTAASMPSGMSVFTDDVIGHYAYVLVGSDDATGNAQYMYAYITGRDGDYTIIVDRDLTGLKPSDTVRLYNEITNQIWIPRLRANKNGASAALFAFDEEGNINDWYFPTSKKLVQMGGRMFSLSTNGGGIIASQIMYYERVDTDSSLKLGVYGALNIDLFNGYLFVFFRDKIGIVLKKSIDNLDGTQTDYFVYQDLVSTGLYSENSYLLDGQNFYFFGNDKRFRGLNITVGGDGTVVGTLEDQSFVVEDFFNLFDGGNVELFKIDGVINIVYKTTGKTQVFKYYKQYQAWLRDEYDLDGNFMNFLVKLGSNNYTCNDNNLCKQGGLSDLGEDIDQKITIYGPVSSYMEMFQLLQFKIRIGYDGTYPTEGIITCEVGGLNKTILQKSILSLPYFNIQTSEYESSGLLGESISGGNVLGGDGGQEITLSYSEMVDLIYHVGKQGQYFKLTIENDSQKELFIGGIVAQYNVLNTLMGLQKITL